MARNSESKTARDRFAALLAKHLAEGTRPSAMSGEPWTYTAFAREIRSDRSDDGFASPRAVANWCEGKFLPDEIESILRALFGANRAAPLNQTVREELREAFIAARAEKNAGIVRKAQPNPAGGKWVADGDQFVLDRHAKPTDRDAAADPLRQQLQTAIRDAAKDLAERAKRLGNAQAWSGLSTTATRFGAVVDCPAPAVAERLGEAYALALRLGGFLETDIRLQRDPTQWDDPLEPDLHGMLTHLVRMAAPWLRGFPTVAGWDDAAARQLMRPDLFQPAREFTRIAREKEAISGRDAVELDDLAEAAKVEGVQGEKAAARTVAEADNLFLLMAEIFARDRAKVNSGGRPLLAERAGATLAGGGTAAEALAAAKPDDLRLALQSLTQEARGLGKSDVPATPVSVSPIPVDVESQARTLILDGRAPPAEWRPFIRRLILKGEKSLEDLTPLAGLTALQTLNLDGTQATDVTALSGLTSLQTLELRGTRVTDVGALSALTELRTLDLKDTPIADARTVRGLSGLRRLTLWNTAVSDATPLAGLTALETLDLDGTPMGSLAPLTSLTSLSILYLRNTHVSDIAPLARLTSLRILYLGGTQVLDIMALSGLSTLVTLDLSHTRVSDLTPLSGLTRLKSLDLSGMGVTDLAPLSGLTALERLDLSGMGVTDLTPLSSMTALESLHLSGSGVTVLLPVAGLTALQGLYLNHTQVSDIRPLAGLTAMQNLDLEGTQVGDVTPLAGLTALETLDLTNTPVTDLMPLAHLTGLTIIGGPSPRSPRKPPRRGSGRRRPPRSGPAATPRA